MTTNYSLVIIGGLDIFILRINILIKVEIIKIYKFIII